MPSIRADLEKKSIHTIEEQLEYLKYHRSPGLLNGWLNCADEAKEFTEAHSNTTVEWLNGSSRQRQNEIGKIPMCCEICLTLSYAGHPWSLRLSFTPRQPWMPPDILMLTADGFMEVISMEFLQEKIGSLRRWPEGRRESVAELISELYLLYKEYNLAKLQKSHPDFEEQCRLFREELQLEENHIEVHLKNTERTVCVQLPIKFDELPEAVFPESRGCSRCVLQLSSSEDNASQFRAFLHMSPKAESLLVGGNGKTFELPPVPHGFKSLVTYSSSVICLINERLKKSFLAFEIRKQVVAQLLCQYEAAVSQYDKDHFSTIELLLQEDDFHYLVDIKFPHSFPHDSAPIVYLRSICEEGDEQAVSHKVSHVSHSFSNDPEEIMKRILMAAKLSCRTFKLSCPS